VALPAFMMSGPGRPTPPAKGEPKFQFKYYSACAPYRGYDGLSFGTVYGAVVAVVVALVVRRGEVAFEHMLCCALPALLHVMLFLAAQWSVEVRCFVRFRLENEVERATHVKVSPILPDDGQGRVRKVLLVPVVREGSDISIVYQRKKLVFDHSAKRFQRLKFDVSLPLGTYMNATGLRDKDANTIARKYGLNDLDIPIPTFEELFQEHAVAPFFVFQVFCVLLWLMDDYWYYSLVTLFMLIVLECQMVQRRRHDLRELRAMRIPPRPIHVYRDSAWKTILSNQLVPGDIIALMRKVDAPCPCDVLLLQGSALLNEAMLTGESVPQMKVALSLPPESLELQVPLDMKGLHKQHVVNAGTQILMHQNTAKAKNFKKLPSTSSSAAAIGYVLRTGFDTTQGKLCRTIIFSAERVTVTSREALYFIMLLLAFALVSCAYVLYDGLVVAPTRAEEQPRSTFKIFLSVSHIITSVVPPEFPIMLSLGVNLSLVALVQHRIYCTEPFRVPAAGKVETCCFDKTGTLTSDSYEVEGVHGLAKPAETRDGKDGTDGGTTAPQPLPFLTSCVMAACNGLTKIEGEVVGDPLERAALQEVGWIMPGPDVVQSKDGKGSDRLQVLRRWPFASELQRILVLVHHKGPGGTGRGSDFDRVLVLVKGSCEILLPRLSEPPADFAKLHQGFAKLGLRVLCLAAKQLPSELAGADPEHMNREDLEAGLEFCGLLVLRNTEKPNTATTIKQLRRSYHRVVMITGDNPQTACQVAIRVSMVDRPLLILEPAATAADTTASLGDNGHPALEWRSRDDASQPTRPFDVQRVGALAMKHALCVPGWSLARLESEQLRHLAPFVSIFARVSPQQKEQVVHALNSQSCTMMVGDGTNDVGALKHAHVGVSLLTSAGPSAAEVPRKRAGARPQTDLDGQAPIVRLGDASIASPFTHKGDSVKCSVQILRCGRATLSTVLMMYKIMGLNSIVTAFAFSALTLDGVKLGDGQTAAESLLTSMCFFLVSRSAPSKQLAKQMPVSSVFAWPVLLALALQLAVHVAVLLSGWMLASSLRSKDFKRDLDGDFEPNLVNTVIFEIVAAMHASSFLANYEGRPFMQPMWSNRALAYSLGAFVILVLLLAAEVVPELNSALSLVPSPSEEFRWRIVTLVVADIALSVLLSKAVSSFALMSRGRAAERRAQDLGLGLRSS